MVERRESHQCEIQSLIDPQRLDLQTEAMILVAKSRLELDEAVAELLDLAHDMRM